MNKKKRTVKNLFYLRMGRLLPHSVYSGEVDGRAVDYFVWLNVRILSFFRPFYKSYTVFGLLWSPMLWKWPRPVVHRQLLLLRWFYIYWVPSCGKLLNILSCSFFFFFLKRKGEQEGSLTHVKRRNECLEDYSH